MRCGRGPRRNQTNIIDWFGILVEKQGGVITVGAFETKTHLSALLQRVAGGEEVVITRHGKPIARPVPAAAAERGQVDAAIARPKAARAGVALGGLDWKELRDVGRR